MSGPFSENNTIPLPKWIYPIQIDGDNQYIDFKESGGGSELSAVIDAGWYLPEDLADAVETAMNAAAASGDYTVSFNRTTEKYTIATDLGYLDILWNTGSHAASACHTEMGYASGGDDTGSTSYVSDSKLPNRFVQTAPLYNVKSDFPWVREVQVADAGPQSTNWRRQERSLSFAVRWIAEQDLLADWKPFLVDSGVARGHPCDFYPNSLGSDYVRVYVDMKGWPPKKMDIDTFYEWGMDLREKIPAGGTVSLEDLFTRTAP